MSETWTKKTEAVAKLTCQKMDWQITNFKLQKLLYFCHMYHLGILHVGLIDMPFEAWDGGPVIRAVYDKVKPPTGQFVSKDVFAKKTIAIDATSEKVIEKVCRVYGNKSFGEIARLAHRRHGAWERVYEPRKNKIIPDELIVQEFELIKTNALVA